jgi:hypothetical protein
VKDGPGVDVQSIDEVTGARPRRKDRGARSVGNMVQVAYASREKYLQEAEENDRNRAAYVFGITFIHRSPARSLGSQGRAMGSSGALADMECVHGRLPGDPCPQPAKMPRSEVWRPGSGYRPLWTSP